MHRGQITGLATFTNFVGMGIGAFCFQQLIAFGFTTALAIFASAQAPGCMELIRMARARLAFSLR
jgi:hypothetical protein